MYNVTVEYLKGQKRAIRQWAYAIADLSEYCKDYAIAYDNDNEVVWAISAGDGVEEAKDRITWEGVKRIEVYAPVENGPGYETVYITTNKSLEQYLSERDSASFILELNRTNKTVVFPDPQPEVEPEVTADVEPEVTADVEPEQVIKILRKSKKVGMYIWYVFLKICVSFLNAPAAALAISLLFLCLWIFKVYGTYIGVVAFPCCVLFGYYIVFPLMRKSDNVVGKLINSLDYKIYNL